MINPGLFSSEYKRWATPQQLFDKLNEEFHFTLDACATPETAKCPNYYAQDALNKDWPGIVFCNPPYGREIGKWVRKGYEEAKGDNTIVVMLLPARTDTHWWHEWVMKAFEVWLIRGRLKFEDEWGLAENSAPFPSCVVIFNRYYYGTPRFMSYDPR